MTCSDGTATATDEYVLTVTNTNDAPTVASAIADASTAEDAAYSLNAAGTCTDVDAGDALSYTISGAPSTITATTAGVISGTPVNANVGAHTITVTCTDGSSATATDSYVLTVTNTNDAPTVASAIADASTAEDAAYSLTASSTCTDVDSGDSLSYTISGAPSTITATTAGVISGTPVNANVGAHTITVTCSDGTATATDEYVLTVTNTNDAPTVASAIADVSAAEDAAYSLDASGTCTDVDASDTMSYTISGGP
ncbi:MAG: hypothetical protein GY914_10360, partial [Prochlorococcus sp.]|nr:hypothetical protein [Prochlorococcus sp.]